MSGTNTATSAAGCCQSAMTVSGHTQLSLAPHMERCGEEWYIYRFGDVPTTLRRALHERITLSSTRLPVDNHHHRHNQFAELWIVVPKETNRQNEHDTVRTASAPA